MLQIILQQSVMSFLANNLQIQTKSKKLSVEMVNSLVVRVILMSLSG